MPCNTSSAYFGPKGGNPRPKFQDPRQNQGKGQRSKNAMDRWRYKNRHGGFQKVCRWLRWLWLTAKWLFLRFCPNECKWASEGKTQKSAEELSISSKSVLQPGLDGPEPSRHSAMPNLTRERITGETGVLGRFVVSPADFPPQVAPPVGPYNMVAEAQNASDTISGLSTEESHNLRRFVARNKRSRGMFATVAPIRVAQFHENPYLADLDDSESHSVRDPSELSHSTESDYCLNTVFEGDSGNESLFGESVNESEVDTPEPSYGSDLERDREYWSPVPSPPLTEIYWPGLGNDDAQCDFPHAVSLQVNQNR